MRLAAGITREAGRAPSFHNQHRSRTGRRSFAWQARAFRRGCMWGIVPDTMMTSPWRRCGTGGAAIRAVHVPDMTALRRQHRVERHDESSLGRVKTNMELARFGLDGGSYETPHPQQLRARVHATKMRIVPLLPPSQAAQLGSCIACSPRKLRSSRMRLRPLAQPNVRYRLDCDEEALF